MATVELPHLINEEYFKKYSPIPQNYTIDELKPYFEIAETLWVKPLVGTPLYEELLDQVAENNVSPENSTLLLRIYPYLSFAICLEALPFIAYHFSQVGVTKGKSDNSDSVSINDVNFISTNLRSQVESLKKMLRQFLEENADYFPLYKPDNCGSDASIDSDCKAYPWLWDYYHTGLYDREGWINYVQQAVMKRNSPNAYTQLYSTKRFRTDIR